MKRKNAVIFVIIWAVIILAVTAYVFTAWSTKGESMGLGFGISGSAVMLKEEEASAQGIKSIEITMPRQSIELKAADGENFRITQYGSKNTPDDAVFKLTENGGHIVVSDTGAYINIGINLSRERIIIEIPRSWHGSATILSRSGSIVYQDEFKLGDFSAKTSSGSIKLEGIMEADSVSLSSSSGSIKIKNDLNAREDFSAETASGSIASDGDIKAHNVEFGTSSGSIHINGALICGGEITMNSISGTIKAKGEITAGTLEAGTTSGSIDLEQIRAEGFEIGCASGSVKIEGLSGGGKLKTLSGSIAAGLLHTEQTTEINAESTSGSIVFNIPYDMAFGLDAKTISGSVSTNLEGEYGGNLGQSAAIVSGAGPEVNIIARTTSGSVKINRED